MLGRREADGTLWPGRRASASSRAIPQARARSRGGIGDPEPAGHPGSSIARADLPGGVSSNAALAAMSGGSVGQLPQRDRNGRMPQATPFEERDPLATVTTRRAFPPGGQDGRVYYRTLNGR